WKLRSCGQHFGEFEQTHLGIVFIFVPASLRRFNYRIDDLGIFAVLNGIERCDEIAHRRSGGQVGGSCRHCFSCERVLPSRTADRTASKSPILDSLQFSLGKRASLWSERVP